MLDQNTDRMWYVIGAVIVGAALIFLLNGTLPDLFASVGGTFQEKTEQATEMTDGIRPKTKYQSIYNKDVHISTFPVVASLVDYTEDTGEWELSIPYNATGWSGGLTVRQGVVEVPYGATMTIQYDVWSPIDTYASNDVNNVPVDGSDGWSNTTSLNDNDAWDRRTNVGENYGPNTLSQNKIPAGEWTTITFAYENTSELNTEKLALYDYSTFGVHNPTESPIRIKIRNVEAVVTMPKE